MILVKAPLRISIGGGGTDLPAYYEQFGSEFISAAINKYIYVAVNSMFSDEILVKYSQTEKVRSVEDLKHPIVREALKHVGVEKAVEISSFADIPAGTGLGSSGTFSVALLKALMTYTNRQHTNMSLAEEACRIEIEKLRAPIGKQDQYIAAVGGLTRFKIDRKGMVSAEPLHLDFHTHLELEDHLLMFFTGATRSASEILSDQDAKLKEANSSSSEIVENLHLTKEIGIEIGRALESGELSKFGELMDRHWKIKRERSKSITSGPIDQWYELAKANGALGGKLIGAGGGGFLMFLAEDNRRLRKALRATGLKEVPFRLDRLGAQVLVND